MCICLHSTDILSYHSFLHWDSQPYQYLVSLALNSGKRKDDHLPGKHFLVELVATVFNRRVQVDHLVSDPQLMDHILVKGKNSLLLNIVWRVQVL